ncbi:MAG: photosynthetic complex assembly protein PuhC [Oceanicaulis sp.]
MIDQALLHRRAGQAAIAMVVGTLILTAAVRFTGSGSAYEPEGVETAALELLFTDEPGGVVSVFDASTGAQLTYYGENEGVFVRSVMRSVARQRRMRGQGPEIPVRLARMDNDQLWLIDPASGVDFYLGAFGPDNVTLFEDLLARDGEQITAQAEGDRP